LLFQTFSKISIYMHRYKKRSFLFLSRFCIFNAFYIFERLFYIYVYMRLQDERCSHFSRTNRYRTNRCVCVRLDHDYENSMRPGEVGSSTIVLFILSVKCRSEFFFKSTNIWHRYRAVKKALISLYFRLTYIHDTDPF